jgi:hypothetical protein
MGAGQVFVQTDLKNVSLLAAVRLLPGAVHHDAAHVPAAVQEARHPPAQGEPAEEGRLESPFSQEKNLVTKIVISELLSNFSEADF